MKFGRALVHFLESYDPGMVSSLVRLSHYVYLSQNILPAGLPSPAFLEYLGGILLTGTLVRAALYNCKFSPVDVFVPNINSTA